jgi:hypothetical protein
MNARKIFFYINLAQKSRRQTVRALRRTYVNCLPWNDLEMRFRGTIFCEMDDFTQTPHEESLVPYLNLKNESYGHNIVYPKPLLAL